MNLLSFKTFKQIEQLNVTDTHVKQHKNNLFCQNFSAEYNYFPVFIEFCPVDCDWEKEMMCPGQWDPKGEQISPDTCMPHKNGDCAAHCPQECGEKDMMCPGKTHADGCKDADYCAAGSKFIFIYNLGKGHSLEYGSIF